MKRATKPHRATPSPAPAPRAPAPPPTDPAPAQPATTALATAAPPPAQSPSLSQLPPTDASAEVFAWIIAGNSEHQITQTLRLMFPDANAGKLLIAAWKQIAASANFDHDSLIGWCLEATRTVYQRSLEAGDNAGALRAIKQLHALAMGCAK